MSASLERLARNQTLFREVNERLLELSDGNKANGLDFLCECSREECVETIGLALEEYEEVRSTPTAFLIVPGHETPAVERIVGGNSRYIVVEKTNGVGFAIETNPRAGDGNR
jgi:hypothetical protein